MEKIDLFPNSGLIIKLYKKYYIENAADQTASSYWQKYGRKYQVKIDDAKNIIIDGGGRGELGNLKTNNVITELFNYFCILSHFIKIKNKKEILQLLGVSRKICKKMGFYFSLDCFRQICSLSLVINNMDESLKRKRVVFLMIGDGYGFLSAVIKSLFPNSILVMVDLGKILLLQSYYCQKAHSSSVHTGIDDHADLKTIDFLYCPAEDLQKLTTFRFDIVMNIVSMQEMNYPAIERYFHYLRAYCNDKNLFYCSNRESKTLPGGEIIDFDKYLWSKQDKILIDELCPWHKYFFSLRPARNGPRIFGIRIPFVSYYNGSIRHRLSIMHTAELKLNL